MLNSISGNGGTGGKHGIGHKFTHRGNTDRRNLNFVINQSYFNLRKVDKQCSVFLPFIFESFQQWTYLSDGRRIPMLFGGKIIVTGNPDGRESHFFQICGAIFIYAYGKADGWGGICQSQPEDFCCFARQHVRDKLRQIEVGSALSRLIIKFAFRSNNSGRVGYMNP